MNLYFFVRLRIKIDVCKVICIVVCDKKINIDSINDELEEVLK